MRLIDLEGDTNFTLQNQSAVKGQKLGLQTLLRGEKRLEAIGWNSGYVQVKHIAQDFLPVHVAMHFINLSNDIEGHKKEAYIRLIGFIGEL